MEIMTRAEAKRQGLKYYFTGEPCKHQHVCERYTSNGNCAECSVQYTRAYHKDRKDDAEYRAKNAARANKWYRNNLDRALVLRKERYCATRDRVAETNKKYRENNRDKILEQKREHYRANRDKYAEAQREYRAKNPDKIAAYQRAWHEKHSKTEKFKQKRRRYERKLRLTNPEFRIKQALRARLNCAIKNNAKTGSAIRDLGCTIPELKAHLEAQFQEGMSWQNYGYHGWHLDHVIPLASFDLTDRAQLKKACHYSNLQPLWAADNFAKSAKEVTP